MMAWVEKLKANMARSPSPGKAMRRRDFITGIAGSAAAWPLAAHAQAPAGLRRIGWLNSGLAADDAEGGARLAAFMQRLQDHTCDTRPVPDIGCELAERATWNISAVTI